MTELGRIQNAIRKMHNVESKHIKSVRVKEVLDNQTWEGVVEVFDLQGDEPATRLYAWVQISDDGKKRVVTVLHRHQIESPTDAVRAAIVKHCGDMRKP